MQLGSTSMTQSQGIIIFMYNTFVDETLYLYCHWNNNCNVVKWLACSSRVLLSNQTKQYTSSICCFPLLACSINVMHENDVRFGSSLHPVVCRRSRVLFVLFVFFACGGVQHICCVFVLFLFVLCTLCCQFPWIVHF